MRLLCFLALICMSTGLFAQSKKLTGKWNATSDSEEWEELVYEFREDGTMLMIVDQEEYPTVNGITYSTHKRKGKLQLEMTYTSPWNEEEETLMGLIDFVNRDQIKLEIFTLEPPPDPLTFTPDALLFDRM